MAYLSAYLPSVQAGASAAFCRAASFVGSKPAMCVEPSLLSNIASCTSALLNSSTAIPVAMATVTLVAAVTAYAYKEKVSEALSSVMSSVASLRNDESSAIDGYEAKPVINGDEAKPVIDGTTVVTKEVSKLSLCDWLKGVVSRVSQAVKDLFSFLISPFTNYNAKPLEEAVVIVTPTPVKVDSSPVKVGSSFLTMAERFTSMISDKVNCMSN